MKYAELQVTSNFSFLRGASHPEELVDRAAALGYSAIALTDRNTVAGVVRAHVAAKKKGIRFIPGCRLDLQDGLSLLVYPINKNGWAQLCTLLSTGNLRTEKGECLLYKKDVCEQLIDVQVILLPPETLNEEFSFEPGFADGLSYFYNHFRDKISLAATRYYLGDDGKHLAQLAYLSTQYSIPLAATNDVHYHVAERRQLQDVLTCIREACTIHSAGYRLLPNAERYLKPPSEMQRLFLHYSNALQQSTSVANACTFSLDELQYEYPEEITTDGRSPQQELAYLAWKGAKEYFGEPLPHKTKTAIEYELEFIEQMNYAAYFLTVHDIVRFARSRNILCQGRGSAANSTVCFCLGITAVNPEKFDLLFERFLSAARNEPPDIDVDFEHERREEVIQYIYEKYGRHRSAIVATVTQMHGKGAVRDVGKVMGLSKDVLDALSGTLWWFAENFEDNRLKEVGLDPTDKHLRKTLDLTRQYMGFPRQLGQHTGGFVITRRPIMELCPILNARMPGRTCIEWNKDDIDALKFLKIDVLALGMLTCISKAFKLTKQHYNLPLTLASIPQDDPAVYDMICAADTIGVFQIESRAQQSMLPRLRPRCFYDLVIEVAIVRPGPIQGDMVHPYLRRRNKEEDVAYPSKELEEILSRTLGVPLFQEQAMKIAIVAGGFTPAEADELRRSMATFKLQGAVSRFHQKLVNGMMNRGYTRDYAERVFRQLEGFGSYGFPESHAASFAQLVYVSCWLKCHYPDVFACALLNSMPMGFYQPAQIVQDAQQHGVMVLPVDVNDSTWDHYLISCPSSAGLEREEMDEFPQKSLSKKICSRHLRLGFRLVKSLREDDVQLLVQKRGEGYQNINNLRDAGLSLAALTLLADADAFRSIGLDRRQALWEITAQDHPKALFEGQPAADGIDEQVALPTLSNSEQVVQDYRSLSLSVKAHPVSFLRPQLDTLSLVTTKMLGNLQNGTVIGVAGLVLVRQRPATAKGVCFMTIEDETGFANLVIFSNLFELYRTAILQSKLIIVQGTVQIEAGVVHLIVQSLQNANTLLRKLTQSEIDIELKMSRADERSEPTQVGKARIAKQQSLFESRDFK